MDYFTKLTLIANENIRGQGEMPARNIRDKMIDQFFSQLSLRERFELKNKCERDHMERLVEEKYPGRFHPDQMEQVIDQLLAKIIRKTEVLSASGQARLVTDVSTPFWSECKQG